MELKPNSTNSFVQFFDKNNLKKERELIDSWDYEICNQYGMDCLFVSQKAKFPAIKKPVYDYSKRYANPLPNQNDLFFHAYGEISRPEYNEPFWTRAYIQFTEDLFAINGFGLNADLNTTLIFNKTSFALDGALAMADSETISKRFTFNTEIDKSNKYATVNYKAKGLQFKTRFDWNKSFAELTEGELFEFNIDPENKVKPDVLSTFQRRYSALKCVEKSSIYFKCEDKGINPLSGGQKISGTCIATFVVKNPWRAYSEYLNRITPSVGDIVLINGIDDNIIKLELTEVEAENKTAQGISPLLGSYSFKCTAKPYIADNSASAIHDPIVAPTDINAKKLIIQTVINHDASKIADTISTYEKLYTDDMGMDFTEDDVYGGYDLEPPLGLNNPPHVPVNHQPINSNERTTYKWDELSSSTIEITDDSGKTIASYKPDDAYTYLKNLMDSNYTDYLVQQWMPDISVSYDMFDNGLDVLSSTSWRKCLALNVPLWYDVNSDISTRTVVDKYEVTTVISTISAYTEADRRLHQLLTSPSAESLFNSFISANQSFISFTNKAAYDGIPNKYGIPVIQSSFLNEYLKVINDKKDAMPIDISSSDVYELSSYKVFREISNNVPIYDIVWRYKQNPDHKYNLRTDLYDIEQYNIGSSDFAKVVKETTPEFQKWKQINIKKMNGPLITIHRFENKCNSRLSTNGESLFFETELNGAKYRTEITSFDNEISATPAETYNGLSVPLNRKLNWIEADNNCVYFNNAYGKRIRLYGDSEIIEDNHSHLNYENDLSSPQDAFILTFKNSKYYLAVQPSSNGPYTIKLGS